ncbi:hypothetical protein Y1Q_0021487 [Alligator mississippiensis]|uniref:Uncharacterized protein n=1 Tax=Alligator mississippiensis TaxID=8496 RepID=A0A151P9Z4_ALLMI|nr:hypothetical protein Y1Q_0021487 [Alligator mississippiensis]
MEYMGWFWLLHDMELSVELAVLWQQVSPREVLGDLDRDFLLNKPHNNVKGIAGKRVEVGLAKRYRVADP